MANQIDTEWDDRKIATLTRLWTQTAPQLSANAIAAAMGITKNAVVGKARRLGLQPRPSPIRRGMGGPKAPQRSGGSPALAVGALLTLPAPAMMPRAEPAPRVVTGVSKPCCWPIGDVGTPNFHFCGIRGEPGRPYCARHCEMAYVRGRDRSEHAA